MRSYVARTIARNYMDKQEWSKAKEWLARSMVDSAERETLWALAEFHYRLQEWEDCFKRATECLAMNVKRDGFTYEAAAWGAAPYDIAAIAAYHTKRVHTACELGAQALALEPDNQRLIDNLNYYRAAAVESERQRHAQ